MSNLSIKNFTLPMLAGAVSSVLHYLYKVDSPPMTRVIDALFAGCIVPVSGGLVFYKMKKEKYSWKEAAITGAVFYSPSMILTVVYMFR